MDVYFNQYSCPVYSTNVDLCQQRVTQYNDKMTNICLQSDNYCKFKGKVSRLIIENCLSQFP